MPKEVLKRPVSIRALIQRIGRKLAKQGKQLRSARTESERNLLGEYYVASEDGISKVSVEELGRELGVLKPWERLEQ